VLACFADLRFASAGAKFTTAHGKLNLPAELGLSWLLPRMIGITRANELLLTSRVFLAEEALSFGLVNAVLPPAELIPYVIKFTRDMISTVSPGSITQTKRQIYMDLHRDVAAAVDASRRFCLVGRRAIPTLAVAIRSDTLSTSSYSISISDGRYRPIATINLHRSNLSPIAMPPSYSRVILRISRVNPTNDPN
jgi:hypothetical protein